MCMSSIYILYTYCTLTVCIYCVLGFCTDFKEESFNESCNGKMVDGRLLLVVRCLH